MKNLCQYKKRNQRVCFVHLKKFPVYFSVPTCTLGSVFFYIDIIFKTILDLHKNYEDTKESFHISYPHPVCMIINILHLYDAFVITNEPIGILLLLDLCP